MGIEIERKFLVRGEDWRKGEPGLLYRQGFLRSSVECVVRVRIQGEAAFITIKGPTEGLRRLEFEYPVPLADAREMLDRLCPQPLMEKYRYRRTFAGHEWEIDEFLGENRGLVVAEVELRSEDEPLTAPEWVDREVTGDPRYYNVNLAQTPYTKWSAK
jgi:adenylate cyclase